MTTFNTDHNNTELLDQELTDEELESIDGGLFFSMALVPALMIAGALKGK